MHFFDIWTSKSGPNRAVFLTLLTWKSASRHNSVHFFDIWTSKSGPNPSVFYTFDLQMCFAPQQRALFRHLNVKKWSELGNVLRATTACTFLNISTSKSGLNVVCFSTWQLPKAVSDRHFLTLLTWKCVSRHNGVHLFDINFKPTLVCFVHFDFEMCFAPQRRAIFHLSSDDSSHLCFSNCPYCRKFHF